MAQTKKMNEQSFAKLVKEFHAVGELIRARQEEKQSIIDEFESEKDRYSAGKLSKKALESSVAKTNKEFLRLDKEIRKQIARANALGNMAKSLASQQAPKVFRAKTSGIFLLVKKVKKAKRKVAQKKKVKKKK
jgi:hypothetical protein